MGSAKVDVRVLCQGYEVDRALARPIRLISPGLAGVVYEGSVYPLHLGDIIDLGDESHPKDACDTFVEDWQDIPYVEPSDPHQRLIGTQTGEDQPEQEQARASGASLSEAVSSMPSAGSEGLNVGITLVSEDGPIADDRCVGITSKGTRCRFEADGGDGFCLLHRTAGARAGAWVDGNAGIPNQDARSAGRRGSEPIVQERRDVASSVGDRPPGIQGRTAREWSPRRLWAQPEWVGPDRMPTDGEPTWGDAFPWLRAAEGDEWGAWWEEPLDGPASLRQARFARISDLAMQRLSDWTVSQICPGLELDSHLWELGLPVRATNAMQREGVRANGQLLSLTPAVMVSWRNVGVGTIDACLRRFAELSTLEVAPSTLVGASKLAPPVTTERAPAPATGSLPSIHTDLCTIARWYATIGQSGQSLLGAPLPASTPATVMSARARIDALVPSDVLDGDELDRSIADHFAGAVSLFDGRAIKVLRERVFADSPATLDELAQGFGVTRERVRQIEGRARAELFSIIVGDGVLATVADAVRALVGIILPLDDLLRHLPALAENVEHIAQPAWRVLDRLDDVYQIENGWCVVPNMEAAQQATLEHLQELADAHGLVRMCDVTLLKGVGAERVSEVTESWLLHCGYLLEDGWVLTRVQNIGDYAASVLAAEGSPLSAQDILDRFVVDRARSSLSNALASDDRFERVDRDKWALKEWGLDAYVGVRSVIRAELAKRGGRVPLGELVESVTARYTVTSSSVAAYASTKPFETTGGIVRFSTGTHEPRKTPERTRRLFRRPEAWVFRITVSADHLRGSGFSAPVGLASVCGLTPGGSIQLPCRLDDQFFGWPGSQPQLGSIRRFLLEDDISAGTDVFLVFWDGGWFDLEPTRERPGTPLADALVLAGINAPDASGERARAELALAVKLPSTSPVSSIIAAYRERGDSDIADLLIEARHSLGTGSVAATPQQSADVDEIMDLL